MSALCFEADGVTPCRGERVIDTAQAPVTSGAALSGFERDAELGVVRRVCNLPRRMLQGGWEKSESGRLMRVRDPVCGTRCWAYQQLIHTEGSDAQLERKAQQHQEKTPA